MPDGPTNWSPEQIESIRNAPDLATLGDLTRGTSLSGMPEEVSDAGLEAASRFISEQGADAGLPDWMMARPPGASRRAIAREFAGTSDIAGAAEGLYREGKITYGQESPEAIWGFIENTPLDDRWTSAAANRPLVSGSGQDATRLNCYEYVHLAAGLSAPEGRNVGAGNNIASVAEPGTVEEWDGESEIPKGKVVIGISEEYGEGPDKTYHFGISMGGGRLANNHGSGPAIEDVSSVFGGVSGLVIYDRILIADYRYIPQGEPIPAVSDEPSEGTRRGTSQIRNDTGERISVSSGGEQVGGILAPGDTSPALTADGSASVQIAGEADGAETAKAIEFLMARGSHTVTPVRKGRDGYEAGPPEPSAAPCCGQPILPLGFFGGSTSPQAAASGCAANALSWALGAAALVALAIGVFVLVGDSADEQTVEPAGADSIDEQVEDSVDPGSGSEQVEDAGGADSVDEPVVDPVGDQSEEEPEVAPPAAPPEPQSRSWSTTDGNDVASLNDDSDVSDPLTEVVGATVAETGGVWTVTIEVTGTDGSIDEAAALYDSIAYVIEVEYADGSFGRWVWERHLGTALNGENPENPSAPPAGVTLTEKTVTFELPDTGQEITRVRAVAFSNEVMGAEESGPELVDEVYVEVLGPGN